MTPWTAAHQACPSFTISWSLLKLMSIKSVMPSNHLILCSFSVAPFSSCPQSFSASGSFPMGQQFTSGDQTIGASASASVLPMDIQGWFSFSIASLISLLSKGLSRVFSCTIVQKDQFFSTQPSLWSNSHTSVHDYWKNHSFDYTKLCWQSDVFLFLIRCLGLS